MNKISLPALFGRSFDELTQAYFHGVGAWLAPVFHVGGLVVIILALADWRRFARLFAVYFLINYVWIFMYAGVVMSVGFFERMGAAFLAFWGPLPLLLLFIVFTWAVEAKVVRNDLRLSGIPAWRFLVVPIMLFGFWYPTYVWGREFSFVPADFLFSAFGLMPCPTTMVVLGLLTLRYPNVNRVLFFSLALFSALVGTAQVAIGYVPDYPLAVLGYYALGLMVVYKIRGSRRAGSGENDASPVP
jgi:hypothetical protein